MNYNEKESFQKHKIDPLPSSSTNLLTDLDAKKPKLSLNKIIDNSMNTYFESLKWKSERILVIDDEEFCITAFK